MTKTGKVRRTLDEKLKAVRETPAGFPFFVSLHDFVQFIESTPSFAVFFGDTSSEKDAKTGIRAAELSPKYFIMKQVHQGIKDIDLRTTDDLGHDRYVTIRELSLIRKKDVSENNSFWKRREALRKMAGDIHKTLSGYLTELDTAASNSQ